MLDFEINDMLMCLRWLSGKGVGGWYIPQLPGRSLEARRCIIFCSLALIMPMRPVVRGYGVREVHYSGVDLNHTFVFSLLSLSLSISLSLSLSLSPGVSSLSTTEGERDRNTE